MIIVHSKEVEWPASKEYGLFWGEYDAPLQC